MRFETPRDEIDEIAAVERLNALSSNQQLISRANGPRTTTARTGPDTRPDLVERHFTAPGPDRLWVADITYLQTFAGWMYCAFVLDVSSHRIVGWQVSTSLRTDLALDALEIGFVDAATRRPRHHRAGPSLRPRRQYVAIRYTERLAEAAAVTSVGSHGDSYDNALAEAFTALFQAELVRNKGPAVDQRPRDRCRRVQ